MKDKKIVVIAVILLLIIIGAMGRKNDKNNTQETSSETMATDISKFDYSIEDGKLILNKYKGREKFVIINDSYTVEETVYEVNEIAHTIFNGCSASVVYLPKTLSCVYDDTLAYLNAEHVELYFGGSEEDWNRIFTQYEKASAAEKWNEGDAEGAGVALADKLNAKFGHKYDESKFSYHFNATMMDIKLD